MKFKALNILLPCHSLEDFPIHHEGNDALGLLVAWSAMWHPAFILSAGSTPSWARADDPPQDLGDRLLMVPQVSESLLLAGWTARAKNEGACLIRRPEDRDKAIAEALSVLDGGDQGFSRELVGDFLALGYAFLQEELLTRQMRYMSNLDETHFKSEVLRAAEAAGRKDEEAARSHLQACFDVLAEARERFYPAATHLVDLTLVGPTTVGPALRLELESGWPLNLLLSGETLSHIATHEPESLAALRKAVESGTATIVGGEEIERELPILPLEAILDEFQHGASVYREHLGQAPSVFGRRRFGLTPLLPQVLSRLGFIGALHTTLDDGVFPRSGQSKSRWEGLDSSSIDILSRIPLDIQLPQTFLSLCSKLSETMDNDHVATVIFAHWPGQSSTWYDDLRRISNRSPVLGKFVTLQHYFSNTPGSGNISKFLPDQYRSPYLKQAIIRRQANPLSRIAALHRRRLGLEQQQTIATLAGVLRSKTAENVDANVNTLARQIQSLPIEDTGESLDGRLQQTWQQAAADFAAAMPRAGEVARGTLLVNPLNFTRRAIVELASDSDLPELADSVKAVQDSGQPGGKPWALVEVPALGYAWVKAANARSGEKETALADAKEMVLRNEFFEVFIDPETGGVRALYDYHHRGNRFSQRLAHRSPGPRPKPGDVWQDPDEMAVYSVSVGLGCELRSAGPVYGEIVAWGELRTDEGEKLSGFRQTFRIARGSRVLTIEIELENAEELRADPWISYYAARFAWPDEDAELYRSIGMTSQLSEAKRLEAPLFVEARTPKKSVTVITGGLPYHRHVEDRMLDTLLVVRGETQRKFRLGVAIDAPQPLVEAFTFLSPVAAVTDSSGPPRGPASSWLFHIDAKNVIATHWETLADEDGKLVGYRVRWQETEGRSKKAKLRSFRKPVSASQIDFRGQPLTQLPVEEDYVVIDFGAFEWVNMEVRF